MPTVPLELGTRSNRSRYGQEGGSRFINAMTEEMGPEGKIAFPIYARPGLRAFATATGHNGTRGLYARSDGGLLAVQGRQLLLVDSIGSFSELGGIPSDGPAYFAENLASPREVAIVSGGLAYVVSGTTLTQIADTDLPGANSCGFCGSYVLFGVPDGRFFWSEANNASSIAALDFATAEGNPDGLVRLVVKRLEVWLFGQRSTEVYSLTGDAENAFQRLPGAYIERGCLAGASVASIEDLLIWVADDGTVRGAEGYSGTRISTHGLERLIAAEADKGALVAWTISDRGHSWYVLSGAGFTQAFNLTTKTWVDWQSYGSARFKAQHHAKIGDRHIVGDATGAALYEMSADLHDDAGDPLVWTIEAPILHKYPSRLTLGEIAVDVVAGQGLNSTSADLLDPTIGLSLSKDGGTTWAPERRKPIGRIGQTKRRVRWHRNGQSSEDGFKLRLSASAAVARGISGASVDVEASA